LGFVQLTSLQLGQIIKPQQFGKKVKTNMSADSLHHDVLTINICMKTIIGEHYEVVHHQNVTLYKVPSPLQLPIDA